MRHAEVNTEPDSTIEGISKLCRKRDVMGLFESEWILK
jgi:hypothetical protein